MPGGQGKVFMYDLLPYRGYTEPVLSEEFLGSLGYARYRVVVPGPITILFAAPQRCRGGR